MKNLFRFFALFLVVASFASCRKDYTCTCELTFAGAEPTTVIIDLPNLKKSEAEAQCESSDAQEGYSCTLN